MFGHRILRSILTLAAIQLAVGNILASPQYNTLLRLVPAGCEVVAGIGDPGNRSARVRILVNSRGSLLDFADISALAGSNAMSGITEVVQVATSSSAGPLREHLLLASGQFDQARIFQSALTHGATRRDYNGVAILIVWPLARESKQMTDVRWMAVLDGTTVVFGTPTLLQLALNRYSTHTQVDANLLRRLAQLSSKDNSCAVVSMPVPGLTTYLAPQAVSESLAGVLDHSNMLSIGARFGNPVKIDFILNTLSVEDALAVRNALDIPRFIRAGTEVSLQPYLRRVRVDGNQVQGTVEAPSKNLDVYLEALVNQRLGTETIQ
jgi:hypothetical protein